MASDNDRQSSSTRNRRRKYVINPSFQWKYALTAALAVFLISSIISSVLYGVLHHQARMRFVNPGAYTGEVTLVIFLFGAILSALTAGGVGIWCVIVTHRVCGPLYVLDRYLAQFAQGRIPQPRPLRRKDEFKELYANFLRVTDMLRAGKEAEVLALTEAIRTAESTLDADNDCRRQAVSSLKDQLEMMRRTARAAIGDAGNDYADASAAEPSSSAEHTVSVA